jgi:GGDEF domain-containing protein
VDLAGRYRGEKLVLYLPETLVGGAEQLASRMQERLAQIADAVAGYPLTITCAIVAVPLNGHTGAQLASTALRVARHSKLQGPGKVAVLGRDVQESQLAEA